MEASGANVERSTAESVAPQPTRARLDLKDPQVVLSLLEADQVVAAKRRTRFGRRPLSLGMRAVLWGLRVYVVVMFVIVFMSVWRALHGVQ